jgi:hypothetical protein
MRNKKHNTMKTSSKGKVSSMSKNRNAFNYKDRATIRMTSASVLNSKNSHFFTAASSFLLYFFFGIIDKRQALKKEIYVNLT